VWLHLWIEVTDMASARITQTWPDGTVVEVEVHVDLNYPDAVAEAKAQAVSMWNATVETD
jgi:hypothetical protein